MAVVAVPHQRIHPPNPRKVVLKRGVIRLARKQSGRPAVPAPPAAA